MIKKHRRQKITLRRDLGLFEATVAGVGIIVGAGIYVLIGTAAGLAGNAVWMSFCLAAFVAFLTGLSYAELSSIYDQSSGEYSYIEHTFGKRAAFIIGFLVMVAGITGAAAVSLGFAGYFNALTGFNSIVITALGAIAFFTVLNLVGIRQSMKLNSFLTVSSIIGLLIIIFLAVPNYGSVNYLKFTSLAGVFRSSALIFFAYLGFDSVVQLSEETKNPKKTIPRALLFAIGISTIIYILVAISAVSVVDWKVLGSSLSPLADVASAVMGSSAGILLTIIAILSTSNTILLELIAMSRLLYGMSKDYIKLKFLSSINRYTQTPHFSILIATLLVILFILIGNIETVAEITNFTVFIIFTSINLALIKSRYIKHKKELFHEPLNLGKFPLLALAGIVSTLFLIIQLNFVIIIFGTLIIGAALLIYEFISL